MGPFERVLEMLRKVRLDQGQLFVLMLFFISLLLNFAIFLPNLSDLNPWDESVYLHSGRILVEGGEWPSLAGNPLTALFFGLTYLPFKSSAFWMVHSASLGKLILLSMLWVGAYQVVKELKPFASPLIAMGVLLVTPLSVEMLRFPSDALFASLAALSLWQLLVFHRTAEPKRLAWGSVFIALAALARVDGLVLFAIFLILGLILNIRAKGKWTGISAALLPFSLMIAGSILLHGLGSGDYTTGISERTYANFESGQQLIYSETSGINPVVGSRLEARRLFGTADENQNSVFKAIARNPDVYLERLVTAVKGLPEGVLQAYGIRFAVVLFYFALRGVAELFRRKQYMLLAMLLTWPLHLATGLVITLFRQGHLQFHFYVVFALAALGLSVTLSNLESKFEFRLVSVVLLAFSVYGIVDNKLAIFYGASLALAAIWIVKLIQNRAQLSEFSALLLFLCAGLILREGYPSPKLRELGVDPKEQVVEFLVENYHADTFIGAGSPGVVWASKMRYAGLTSTDVPVNREPVGFLAWIRDQGIEVVYIDHDLSPAVLSLMDALIGQGLERVFVLEQGDFQILNVITDP
jgi:hypothetical protein